ncbi:Protein CBR-SRT-24 [Caenorhabditis briggsae]|uniref:Protein CBR-SRT-24 n=1 Tax=Caenorhabditis briggsae TaxID=6238 RepID=A8XBM2_CAEBR|nr:Protein CBR-SRT-24 [Caenorhabditis briggsae]CAP30038.2 Protein CBR-SRT-24 [Caenorhabditis briggsae]
MEFIGSDIDQSYNYVIRHGFHLNEWFYNCTGIDGFALGVPRPWLGSYFLTVGVVLMRNFLRFAFFRSYGLPDGCWMGSCATCILLGINRCCDVNQNLKIRKIFLGWKIYPTLLVPVLYTLYAIFFTKTASFNSNLMSWFFNPLLPNGRLATDYVNLQHAINNCIVSGATTLIYTYLCVILFAKSRFIKSESMTKTQRQVFFQSVLICSFNAVAAYIYVYMQYFTPAPITIIIGQIAWQWSHGSVCLIYITMNRSVRRGVLDLFLPKSFRNKHKIGTYQEKIHRLSFSVGTKGTTKGPTSSGTAVF